MIIETEQDLIDFFGEVRPVTKGEVAKRGHWIIKDFENIGKRVKFESELKTGVLIGIGKDSQDYVLTTQYKGYIIHHSPLERYKVI